MQSSTRLAPAAPRQELKEALQELKDALYNRALELDGPASLKAMQSVNHAVAQDDGTATGSRPRASSRASGASRRGRARTPTAARRR